LYKFIIVIVDTTKEKPHNSASRRKPMEKQHIATLTLNIDAGELRAIVSSGRLLQFAEIAATQAAEQIPAQIVHNVAEGALHADGLKAGVSVSLGFARAVADEGDDAFLTVGPHGGPPVHGGSTPSGPRPNPFANLSMTIEHEALRQVVTSGRLLEFSDTAASDAATQIFSQIVQHVAEGAMRAESLVGGVSVKAEYQWVTEDGEPGFGNGRTPIHIPIGPPQWGVNMAKFEATGLRKAAGASGGASAR
jgi:hypothetical protein